MLCPCNALASNLPLARDHFPYAPALVFVAFSMECCLTHTIHRFPPRIIERTTTLRIRAFDAHGFKRPKLK